MVKEKYKEKLISLIAEVFPQSKIYLYGSRAREDYSPYSDIDVAVDVGSRADARKMAKIRLSLDDLNIPLDIDVVDFYEVSRDMQRRIKEEGVLWKG